MAQRRSRVAVFTVVGVAGMLTTALARPSEGSPQNTAAVIDRSGIEESLFRCWREETFEQAGKMHRHPYQLSCWRLAAEEIEIWEFSGDLSPCVCPHFKVHIDPAWRPMRLDVICEREHQRSILPGIFKFEGGRLIWVSPDWHADWVTLDRSGEYPSRPRDFTSTPTNGQDRRVLIPCELYEQVRPGW
jgi:hypothetical protein